jgi:NAD(P)-dependent dehydrogenase (short-subunit alcohol dehydrogenase family)
MMIRENVSDQPIEGGEQMRLKDKVAVITGADRGIGKGIADRFAREGAAVILAQRDVKLGESVAASIREAGHRAEALHVDVSKPEDVENLVQYCRKQFGKIDILVNNAAWVAFVKSFLEMDLKTWEEVLDTNLTGMFLCGQAVSRLMVETKIPGRIINLASINSFAAERFGTAYVTSKAGVLGLTRSMAVELAPYGILVNALAPGPILTETTQGPFTKEPYRTGIEKGTLLQRPGNVEEVSSMAVFLASDESSYVTGSTFLVDGGLLAYLRFD